MWLAVPMETKYYQLATSQLPTFVSGNNSDFIRNANDNELRLYVKCEM